MKLAKDQKVKRAFELADIRAVTLEGGAPYIEGHAAVYDQETLIGGWFKEVIERGAFEGTDFDDVLFSANHDLRKIPLARSRRNNGNSTMQLSLDDVGLKVRAELDIDNNADARSLHSSVQRGDMDGMSFIFYVGEETWEDLDEDIPTRRIQKVSKVIEVSAVNFPAYEGTDINARDTLDNAKKALDNARSKQGEELDNSQILEVERLRAQIKSKI